MASRFKLTGFARFFFALVIIVPLAYFGASYLNGEDGWGNLKKMVGIDLAEDDADDTTTLDQKTEPESKRATKSDNAEIDRLKKRISELEKENERLEQTIKNREREIELLKK
ncbi:MAG: hypothetical protein DWQ02_21240 [Bacteroidetes bacterium]|nr:MAG: hypothetical protein DWQ02_21240 [Bacteroidota bacterium]